MSVHAVHPIDIDDAPHDVEGPLESFQQLPSLDTTVLLLLYPAQPIAALVLT